MVWAVSKFRTCLFKLSLTVVTDYRSLCWLLEVRYPSRRLACWLRQLQQCGGATLYRFGRKQRDPDCVYCVPRHCERNFVAALLATVSAGVMALESIDIAVGHAKVHLSFQ